MKLKSLFLGSAAALALTSGALAADPRSSFVSLDVCDAYGITGLTIASSDTCLKISGSVSYEFHWGDYRGSIAWAGAAAGNRNIDLPNTDPLTGKNDWRSRMEAILSFEATTQTDAGAAKAHITLRERNYVRYQNNVLNNDGDEHPLRVQDAWVSFGDTTVLMAGKKGSIAKLGDDEPFNFLGLANSQSVDHGVLWSYDKRDVPNHLRTGGHVIQIVSEVADGVSVGIGLESLDGAPGYDDGINALGNSAGTLVGFVEAKGAWGQAHLTAAVGNVLTDHPDALRPWGIHAGGTFNFDNFKVRGALATDNTGYWNALLSGEAAFDLFTIAASAEFINTGTTVVSSGGPAATPPSLYGPANALIGANISQMGLGASVGFQATETVKINAGFRYFDNDTATSGNEGWQAALQVAAAVAEGIEATGTIGVYGGDNVRAGLVAAGLTGDMVGYLDLGATYKPGGGFETGAGVEFNSAGAYKLKFNAKKTF